MNVFHAHYCALSSGRGIAMPKPWSSILSLLGCLPRGTSEYHNPAQTAPTCNNYTEQQYLHPMDHPTVCPLCHSSLIKSSLLRLKGWSIPGGSKIFQAMLSLTLSAVFGILNVKQSVFAIPADTKSFQSLTLVEVNRFWLGLILIIDTTKNVPRITDSLCLGIVASLHVAAWVFSALVR